MVQFFCSMYASCSQRMMTYANTTCYATLAINEEGASYQEQEVIDDRI
ncbi:MAG TPA: hypothetical protein VHF44_01275 [Nitrososphaeraceae archaeon]|nr:hypothetical protein [Nitrososphaeraceae archaeon]